jgi:hypothetical protein
MSTSSNGTPDRRHNMRREDDIDPSTARGFEFWVRLMFLHKGKLIALLTALAGAGGYVAGVSGLGMRVGKLEAMVIDNSARIRRLEQSDANKTYMLCIISRATAPNLAPPECGTIITDRTGRP